MPTAEAAACVKEFRRKIVYPYHYCGQNRQEFAEALKNTPGIEVGLRKPEGEPLALSAVATGTAARP
jgi:hypothetical protein